MCGFEVARGAFYQFKPFPCDAIVFSLACRQPLGRTACRTNDHRIGNHLPDCLHDCKCRIRGILSSDKQWTNPQDSYFCEPMFTSRTLTKSILPLFFSLSGLLLLNPLFAQTGTL